MANGFEINITEADFKSRSSDDRQWALFQGIMSLHKDGCAWGVERYGKDRLKMYTAFGVGLSGGIGFIYILYKLVYG